MVVCLRSRVLNTVCCVIGCDCNARGDGERRPVMGYTICKGEGEGVEGGLGDLSAFLTR